LHAKLDQHREASELLERFVGEFPQSIDIDAAWMELAQIRDGQGDRAGSLAALKQISASFPNSPLLTSARHRLAVEAVRDRRYSEARDWLRKLPPVSSADPQGADKLLLTGQVSAALQKWAEVDPPLAELESKFPKSPLVSTGRFWRGEAAWRKGDGATALRYLLPLATDDAFRAAPWRATAVMRAAQQQVRSEKWDEALALATRGAEESPDFSLKPEFDYIAGYCFSRQGKWPAAREKLETAARDPRCAAETSARSMWLVGECLAHEGRAEEAIQAWLRLETRTDIPSWRAAGVLRAAEFRETQGAVEEARSLYARLVRQYASTEQGEEASRRLKQLMPAEIAESGREPLK
jgi:TolA-binding protein